jgi:hypothetical protein
MEKQLVPLSIGWLSENDLLLKAIQLDNPEATLGSGNSKGITIDFGPCRNFYDWDYIWYMTIQQLKDLGFE